MTPSQSPTCMQREVGEENQAFRSLVMFGSAPIFSPVLVHHYSTRVWLELQLKQRVSTCSSVIHSPRPVISRRSAKKKQAEAKDFFSVSDCRALCRSLCTSSITGGGKGGGHGTIGSAPTKTGDIIHPLCWTAVHSSSGAPPWSLGHYCRGAHDIILQSIYLSER